MINIDRVFFIAPRFLRILFNDVWIFEACVFKNVSVLACLTSLQEVGEPRRKGEAKANRRRAALEHVEEML